MHGAGGKVLGRGLADAGFVAVRVYRHDGGPLDDDWLFGVLDRAAALRDVVVAPDTTGYRLVHGEADGLPGVRIDWWDHHAVIVLDTEAARPLVEGVVRWLVDRRAPRSVRLCYRLDPRDEARRAQAGDALDPTWLFGHPPRGDVAVRENGIVYQVRISGAPDVGLYADLREVRRWFGPMMAGRRVLNTFAFTGAFSVAALVGGAAEAVSVDLSEESLDRAEANVVANGIDPVRHTALCDDTFRVLDRFRRTGESFDAIILDPPSFSRTNDGDVWSAKRDWPRLVAAALRVLAPGGLLLAVSNQGELSPRNYRGLVEEGFRKAGQAGREILWATQGPDFPSSTTFPEGRYLKVGCWSV